jgi:predicted ATP-grasp superfamily ATP-dependent carboligase
MKEYKIMQVNKRIVLWFQFFSLLEKQIGFCLKAVGEKKKKERMYYTRPKASWTAI